MLFLLKAREEYPLAEGSCSGIVSIVTFIFEDTDFRQQHCTCLLAEIHLIAFDTIKFDHFVYSSVNCL